MSQSSPTDKSLWGPMLARDSDAKINLNILDGVS